MIFLCCNIISLWIIYTMPQFIAQVLMFNTVQFLIQVFVSPTSNIMTFTLMLLLSHEPKYSNPILLAFLLFSCLIRLQNKQYSLLKVITTIILTNGLFFYLEKQADANEFHLKQAIKLFDTLLMQAVFVTVNFVSIQFIGPNLIVRSIKENRPFYY